MPYAYTNGDGLAVLIATEPVGASEPVSNLDDAVRQIKAYLKDTIAGPHALLTALFPIGVIMEWPAAAAPTNWLICDGAAINRTTYAALFALISTTYGVGNGTTTFNIPDHRDKFVKGKNAEALGTTGGLEEVTLVDTQMPKHRHGLTETNSPTGDLRTLSVNTSGSARPLAANGAAGDSGGASLAASTAYDKAADAVAHENRPPYISHNKIIKVL